MRERRKDKNRKKQKKMTSKREDKMRNLRQNDIEKKGELKKIIMKRYTEEETKAECDKDKMK